MDLPKLLCVMNLPPPIHGASVINQQIALSPIINACFRLEIVPLSFAATIFDLQRPSLGKAVKAIATLLRLIEGLLGERPSLAYYTIAPSGGAFYRDALFSAVISLFGVPLVFHLHGKGIARNLTNPLKRLIYRLTFRNARVILLSHLLRQDISDLVPGERTYIVPNGIPDDGVPNCVSELVSPGETPRILFLSNMVETKGPLVLVEALGILKARGLSFSATFAGSPFADGCIEKFHAAVDRLGLREEVRYVGPIYGESKTVLWTSHNIFAFPTFYPNECFPLVVLEAMKHSLAVVSTDEGAISEIVDNGRTGYIVARRDVVALADRLESLCRDQHTRSAFGNRGREKFSMLYQSQRFERRLLDVLESAIREE